MQKVLAGISTRRYLVGLEPVVQRIDRVATATSKSAISRRFIAATETALSELLAPRLVSWIWAGPGRADDRRRALR